METRVVAATSQSSQEHPAFTPNVLQSQGRTYRYEELPADIKTSFRLLRIESVRDQNIHVSLRIADLQDRPEYDCLSYTWADPHFDAAFSPTSDFAGSVRTAAETVIKCNGEDFVIKENLRQALLELGRNAFPRSEWIWIDAVCISQDDGAEKSRQVQLMRDIYSQAQTVIAWLGIEDDGTAAALEVLQRVAAIPLTTMTPTEVPTYMEADEVRGHLQIETPVEEEEWLAYAGFLSRPWWSRVWVIQETVLAREVTVVCGRHRIAWPTIVASARVLHHTGLGGWLAGWAYRVRHADDSQTRSLHHVIDNQFIFVDLRDRRTALDLERLVVRSRHFNSTNPMDYVYALLGMWTPRRSDGAKAAELIVPDYRSSTVERVYIEATWAILSEVQDLRVLSLVERSDPGSRPELPSWVPDYASTPRTRYLVDNYRPRPGEARCKASGNLAWDASAVRPNGEPPASMGRFQNRPRLPVQGVQVDVIRECAGGFDDVVDNGDIGSLLQLLANALDDERSEGTGLVNTTTGHDAKWKEFPPVEEAFWRSLTKDTYNGAPADLEARRAFPIVILNLIWNLDIKTSNRRIELREQQDEDDGEPTDGELSDGGEGLGIQCAPQADTAEASKSGQTGIEIDAPQCTDAATSSVITPCLEDDTRLELLERNLARAQRLVEALTPRLAATPATSATRLLPGGIIPSWTTIEEKIESLEDDPRLDAPYQRAEQAFRVAYAGRRLFRTPRNRLGIAAQALQPGDAVWVLAGADVPVVLRQAANGAAHKAEAGQEQPRSLWTFVGEAYVHGLMHGEALEVHSGQTEAVPLVDIHLV